MDAERKQGNPMQQVAVPDPAVDDPAGADVPSCGRPALPTGETLRDPRGRTSWRRQSCGLGGDGGFLPPDRQLLVGAAAWQLLLLERHPRI